MAEISDQIAVVIIGRNEGERLERCLTSIRGFRSGVYVDSGSTDGSQKLASDLGFEVVDLDVSGGFTAAKARNAGLQRLLERLPELAFVQMVDGDCEVEPSWPEAALNFLKAKDDVAVVFGRRAERFPHRNIYHEACDHEWNVRPGDIRSCGGDALFRVAALRQVDGYDPNLIAGEEPELCFRLRREGWRIVCIDEKMTLHDADIVTAGQWWRRAKRAGYAFAHLHHLYGNAADPSWPALVRSAKLWSGIAIVGGALLLAGWAFGSIVLVLAGLALATLLPLQVARIAWRHRSEFHSLVTAFKWSALLLFSKFAQVSGWLQARGDDWRSKQGTIIEYK